MCADCLRARSTEAGHKVGRAQGGKYTRANLKGQCRACNEKQREAEKDTDPYREQIASVININTRGRRS